MPNTVLETCGVLAYVLPVREEDPLRATPEACHATACQWLAEEVARAGGALLFPALQVAETETGGAKVSAYYAR
jgi:hypothetical protein